MGKQRGKSDFKGKGHSNVRDRGKKNSLDIKSEEEEQDRNFPRRKIESNVEKYDLPLSSSSEDESLEVKDFDYIKNTEAGLHSHFKFKEEKDWGDVSSSESVNSLQLDVSKLALELSNIGIYKLLQLDKLKKECQYCVINLKEDVNEHSNRDLREKIEDAASINWCNKGFENLRERLLSLPKCHNISSSTNLKQDLRSYKKVGTQTEMFLNKVDLESKVNNSVKNVNMQNATCKAQILTSEMKQEEKNMVPKEVTIEDIELDKLLEISEAHTDFHTISEEQNQEELSDWLDDLLGSS